MEVRNEDLALVGLPLRGLLLSDDFSYQEIDDPNAPMPCMENIAECSRLNGAIQICENRFCQTPDRYPECWFDVRINVRHPVDDSGEWRYVLCG